MARQAGRWPAVTRWPWVDAVKVPKKDFFSIFASWARNGRFEHLFEKNDLRPLRIKINTFLELCNLTQSKIQVQSLQHWFLTFFKAWIWLLTFWWTTTIQFWISTYARQFFLVGKIKYKSKIISHVSIKVGIHWLRIILFFSINVQFLLISYILSRITMWPLFGPKFMSAKRNPPPKSCWFDP
jgi:hypothetical protein